MGGRAMGDRAIFGGAMEGGRDGVWGVWWVEMAVSVRRARVLPWRARDERGARCGGARAMSAARAAAGCAEAPRQDVVGSRAAGGTCCRQARAATGARIAMARARARGETAWRGEGRLSVGARTWWTRRCGAPVKRIESCGRKGGMQARWLSVRGERQGNKG